VEAAPFGPSNVTVNALLDGGPGFDYALTSNNVFRRNVP
jgi:hypothetical protein